MWNVAWSLSEVKAIDMINSLNINKLELGKARIIGDLGSVMATVWQVSRGCGQAKRYFHGVVKAKNDLERLKGTVLFDRVSELHISRLRTKEDLVRMLSV